MPDILTPPPHSDLVSEANHRVANSLALLSGLARLQARQAGQATRPFSNAEVRMMLEGFAARISTIGQLHRMLAHVPPDGTIDLAAYLRELTAILVAAFSSGQQPVHIEHHGVDCRVLTQNVQPLTLAICEIITNALKYSHPAGVAVRLVISCEGKGNGDLQVTVSDDGVGLPEDFDSAHGGGVGFQLIRSLTSEIGAKLDISSDGLGATFRITVPNMLISSARTA